MRVLSLLAMAAVGAGAYFYGRHTAAREIEQAFGDTTGEVVASAIITEAAAADIADAGEGFPMDPELHDVNAGGFARSHDDPFNRRLP